MSDTISAKVFRFDPLVDATPTSSTYEVPWYEYITGLEVLHYINDNIEPIAFDYCCHAGQCGRCSMMIDGVPSLACWTVLEAGEHSFEPLSTYPVMRDLIVDKSKTEELIIDARAEVQSINPIDQSAHFIDYTEWFQVDHRLNMCRECMCCYVDCQAMNDETRRLHYPGPAALAQIAQRAFDPNEEGDRIFQAVTSGLFNCYQCGNCDAVCPAGIPHLELFTKMISVAQERGLTPASKTA